MARIELDVAIETIRLRAPFRISGFVFDVQKIVVVTVKEGQRCGRGEASGVYYLGESAEAMQAAIEAERDAIESGLDRAALQTRMAPGGARNALDCALWELEACRAGQPVWKLAGIPKPKPLVTTFTLGADEPAVMAQGARGYVGARALKVKLTGELELDIARVRAVRSARSDAWIGVDANQGYDRAALSSLVGELARARVSLLEQPLPRGRESELEGFECPIPIAADESALTLKELPTLPGRFNVVNIKLDKCGGLTEALTMARRARELGLGVMVGNMVGTSLAMAPGFVVGQLCDIVDLDGPTFLTADRQPGARYESGEIWCGEEVWGGAMTAVA